MTDQAPLEDPPVLFAADGAILSCYLVDQRHASVLPPVGLLITTGRARLTIYLEPDELAELVGQLRVFSSELLAALALPDPDPELADRTVPG